MQPPEPHATWKARLLRRLAVVVDEAQTYGVRLAAVKAVQSMLDDDHRLRLDRPESLLDRTLHSWSTREELVGGRYAMLTVSRPPKGLRDVWA